MSTTMFGDSDERYFAWLDDHPVGFVVDVMRSLPAGNFVLHRSDCDSIASRSRYRPGAYVDPTR